MNRGSISLVATSKLLIVVLFLSFGPTIVNCEEFVTRVCFSFLFSTQKQVQQVVIGLCGVLYHIEALSA